MSTKRSPLVSSSGPTSEGCARIARTLNFLSVGPDGIAEWALRERRLSDRSADCVTKV